LQSQPVIKHSALFRPGDDDFHLG